MAVGLAVAVGVAELVAVGVAPVAVALGVGVLLGVAVAAVPNATPVRLTVCVGVCPLSVNVNFPVSVVPLGVLSVVGLNVTEIWHIDFAGTEAPQLFAAIANGPLVAIEEKLTATALELESVTVCGAEMVFTWTLPNDRDFGDTVGVTMVPTPDAEIDCVAMYASSVTTIFLR